MKFKTEQEEFWAGDFGNEYIERVNEDNIRIANNISFFSKVLKQTRNVKSIIEFGSNIGINLKALNYLIPDADLSAIEINAKAVEELRKWQKVKKIYEMSILDFTPDFQRDFVFIKGVLIHINPEMLHKIYKLLYQTTKKYICIAEYYNPTPVSVSYRGHEDRLFKRDFAGEMMDKYHDLRLVNYGFVYHRAPNFPLDDLTWFLLEKTV